jgi:HEAT repeat protein
MSPGGGPGGIPGGLPGGPTTPGGGGLWGPNGPFGGAPTTPGGGAPEVLPTDWNRWWTFNRDNYLEIGALLAGRETGSGNGGGRIGLSHRRIESEIYPAIEKVLQEGGDLSLMRECLFALGRIAPELQGPGGGLRHYAEQFLKQPYPDLQEAAIVALGIQGLPESLPLIRSILDNTEEGRKITASESVPPRLRAFAAYSLGLLGGEGAAEDLRLEVIHSLLDSLGNQRTATREIQVACVLAAGQVHLEFCDTDPERLARHKMEGDRHLCGGIQLRYLLDIFRDEELDPWVRAHVAPSIGRLGHGAPEQFRTAVLEELGRSIGKRSDVEEAVQQGCVIGLGLFADGDEDDLDVAARSALVVATRSADPLSRRLAMISLACAAGQPGEGANRGRGLEEARSLLLKQLVRGRGDCKAWAALALGVLGHRRMEAHEVVSEELGGALRRSLSRAKSPQDAAALVLGIGILRDEASRDQVLKSFEKLKDPAFRACAALTLGLTSARGALPAVREVFLEEGEDLDSLPLDVALGLRLLGDEEVTGEFIERLSCAETPEERAEVARFLGALDDPLATGALLAVALDSEEDAPVRSAAVKSLGDMCDSRSIPWSTAYATDLQYELLTWTLVSPFGDGTGLLEQR